MGNTSSTNMFPISVTCFDYVLKITRSRKPSQVRVSNVLICKDTTVHVSYVLIRQKRNLVCALHFDKTKRNPVCPFDKKQRRCKFE